MNTKPDLEQIADLLARAKQYAATIPDGDVRLRAVVGPIELLCDGITTAVGFVNLPGYSAVTVAEWNGRIATMLAQLEGWLVRGEAFGLAQEIGSLRAKRSSGGKRQAEENKAVAAEWQKKITPEVQRLLDARMSADNIGKRLSARAGRDADTVARFARSLKKKSGKR